MNQPGQINRIVDLNEYYRNELKRLDKAMDEAKKKYSSLKSGKLTNDRMAKAAELNTAIRAGVYYRERLVSKIIETR